MGFKSGRLSDLISNVAQILLLWIVCPLVVMVIHLFSPAAADKLVLEILDKIPFVGMWLSILGNILQTNVSISYPLLDIISDLFKTIIIAIAIRFTTFTHTACGFSGAPILATVVGTVAGMILTTVIANLLGGILSLITYVGVIVVLLIGMKLALSSVFSSLRTPMHFISFYAVFDGICAVGCSGYVVILALTFGGYIQDIGLIITSSLAATLLVFVLSVLMKIKSNLEDKEKSRYQSKNSGFFS